MFDSRANEVKVESVDHFFYGGEIAGNLECGSVFRLPSTLKFPFSGQLHSNINALNGITWVEKHGSFEKAAIFFIIIIISSFVLNYLIYAWFWKKKNL